MVTTVNTDKCIQATRPMDIPVRITNTDTVVRRPSRTGRHLVVPTRRSGALSLIPGMVVALVTIATKVGMSSLDMTSTQVTPPNTSKGTIQNPITKTSTALEISIEETPAVTRVRASSQLVAMATSQLELIVTSPPGAIHQAEATVLAVLRHRPDLQNKRGTTVKEDRVACMTAAMETTLEIMCRQEEEEETLTIEDALLARTYLEEWAILALRSAESTNVL